MEIPQVILEPEPWTSFLPGWSNTFTHPDKDFYITQGTVVQESSHSQAPVLHSWLSHYSLWTMRILVRSRRSAAEARFVVLYHTPLLQIMQIPMGQAQYLGSVYLNTMAS